jgi:hypothetical protein
VHLLPTHLLATLVGSGAHLVIGDSTTRDDGRRIAAELTDAPPLDAVIHNAGVWSGPAIRSGFTEGHPPL